MFLFVDCVFQLFSVPLRDNTLVLTVSTLEKSCAFKITIEENRVAIHYVDSD